MASKPILDTCCFINFVASGHAHDLLKAAGRSVCVPEAVKKESLFLAAVAKDKKPIPIDIDNVIPELKLEVVAPENDAEIGLYVSLALELGDGEAMGLAIAKARNLILLTDERKARRIAGTMGVEVLTTPDVVHAWAKGKSEGVVGEVIGRIERSARYTPSLKEPLHEWWKTRVSPAVPAS